MLAFLLGQDLSLDRLSLVERTSEQFVRSRERQKVPRSMLVKTTNLFLI